jgi:hypothetical protein
VFKREIIIKITWFISVQRGPKNIEHYYLLSRRISSVVRTHSMHHSRTICALYGTLPARISYVTFARHLLKHPSKLM